MQRQYMFTLSLCVYYYLYGIMFVLISGKEVWKYNRILPWGHSRSSPVRLLRHQGSLQK